MFFVVKRKVIIIVAQNILMMTFCVSEHDKMVRACNEEKKYKSIFNLNNLTVSRISTNFLSYSIVSIMSIQVVLTIVVIINLIPVPGESFASG